MSKSQNSDSSPHSEMESDIYIQFPGKDGQLESLWPSSRISTVNNNDKQILVILLGWAGAEHKYLSKYSDFYLKRGCVVLKYITPLRYHFVERRKLPELARTILKFIAGLKLESHPTFFHVFSNGGSFTYSYILKELANPNSPYNLDIQGTIFDSSPSPRRLQATFHAMTSIFSNLRAFKYVLAGLVIFALVCQIFWYHLKEAFTFCAFGDTLDSLNAYEKEVAPLTNWLGRIAKMKNHNFLFLYSDADDLIPIDQVEKFASIVEAHGNKVERVRFEGSEHVMHYRRYPKEYGNAVVDFVRAALTGDRGRTTLHEE